MDCLLVLRDTPQRDATALFDSTQSELVSLHLLRMATDEMPPAEWVRLIHFLIKQTGVFRETFQVRNPVPVSDPMTTYFTLLSTQGRQGVIPVKPGQDRWLMAVPYVKVYFTSYDWLAYDCKGDHAHRPLHSRRARASAISS